MRISLEGCDQFKHRSTYWTSGQTSRCRKGRSGVSCKWPAGLKKSQNAYRPFCNVFTSWASQIGRLKTIPGVVKKTRMIYHFPSNDYLTSRRRLHSTSPIFLYSTPSPKYPASFQAFIVGPSYGPWASPPSLLSLHLYSHISPCPVCSADAVLTGDGAFQSSPVSRLYCRRSSSRSVS